ncbi:MAG: chain-length determining protein, partial [Pseudomonadales bacterium]
SLLQKHPYWLAVLIAIVGAGGYWWLWATDRYVSEANVVLQSARMAQPEFSMSSILGGGSSNDLLMLRDHLRSVDMLRKLDTALDLRNHYASNHIDALSRIAADAPMEHLHRYYLKRVSVEIDEYAHVLRVKAQAYDPQTAHAIATLLLEEGEAHMNALGHRLAAEQVRFIETQVLDLRARLDAAMETLLAYQNEQGLVSPTGTVASVSAVVAALEGELASLKAQRSALGASQSERAPEMVRLTSQVNALERQIALESARLAASNGGSLNRLSADFETLRLQVDFAREMYASALTALESTRVEAARSLKQVSILQSPTVPEYATEPRRLYNLTVFALMALLAGLIAHLLTAIVRDHRD